eukprot:scaffold27431_cov140-Isochrysis_galbana.AAC.1
MDREYTPHPCLKSHAPASSRSGRSAYRSTRSPARRPRLPMRGPSSRNHSPQIQSPTGPAL